MDKDGHRTSTLDVTGKGKFTLITGLAGQAWTHAVRELNLPFLRTEVTGAQGTADPYCDWQRLREIHEAGALLVRPDGYIAWRQKDEVRDATQALQQLRSALRGVLNQDI